MTNEHPPRSPGQAGHRDQGGEPADQERQSLTGRTAPPTPRGVLVLLATVTGALVLAAILLVADLVDDLRQPGPAAAPTSTGASSTTGPTATAPSRAPSPTPSPSASSTVSSSAPAPLPTPEVPSEVAPLPGETSVGKTVTDGPFEVEVAAVATGISELSGDAGAVEAEGTFVVVRLRVTATEPATFLDIDQRLTDAGGGEHRPHATAPAVIDGNQLFFADLAAGESAQGVVVFDVPPGTVPANLVVRADEASTGVPVSLPAS
ncbi:hypothetical protein GCM10023169_26790 [Georgenia halophila]|uniref:DUF4352 domain-containing protein n=1 Tax=Georgenia halophila TaxID=620889 RepID=A0ABP8LEQ1_9MICO